MTNSETPQPEHKHIIVDRRLVMINGASSVLTRLATVFGLLWAYQYLLARISPQEFALYPVLTAVMVFAPLFFSFFSGGVTRNIVASYAAGDFTGATRVVSSILPYLAGVTGLFVLVAGVFAYAMPDILTFPAALDQEARIMFGLLAGSFALQMLLLPYGVGLQVKQRFVELNLIGLARELLRVGLLYFLLTTVSASVIWVAVASAVAETLHTLVVTIRSRQLVPELRFERALFDKGAAKELFHFGIWTTLGRLATIFYTSMGTLLLNGFGTATDVTNYHLGLTCFQQIQSMIGIARQPLQPALIAMSTLEDAERLKQATLRDGRYGLWVSLMVACPLAILSHDFVMLLLGPEFIGAADVLVFMMAIFPFSQAAGILPMIAIARGEVRRFNTAALISTLAGLVGMLIASQGFGMGATGVAGALMLVTAIAQVAYFWPLSFQLTGVTPRAFWREVLMPGLAPALASAPIWAGLAYLLAIDSWLALALVAVAGGIVYVGVLLAACLDESDRVLLGKIRRKLTGRA
ncbi:oligosaccharide flippase family protein [Rhodobacteraceae bacterium NNCM2]|nr:oligosaccharide flippase family protein [Coraliihabitans acroporae]